jgi:DNA-binding NtrC family response regulator
VTTIVAALSFWQSVRYHVPLLGAIGRQGDIFDIGRPNSPISWHKMASMVRPGTSASSPLRPGQGKALQRTLLDDRTEATNTSLWLTIVEPNESTMMPIPERGGLRIGRAEDNHIVLASPSVSRYHAELIVVEGTIAICDLGSANGTHIGGQRIAANGRVVVPPGVAVLIGTASLVVHQLGSTSAGTRAEPREVVMAGEHIRALRSGGPGDTLSSHVDRQLVVQSTAMKKLFELVDRVAAGTISVLLVGETGVGKEVVAAAVHERSPRRHKPYLRLNCSAFAENLLESELFGHEAGAFSGARSAKLGLLETANGGTVLLDEIGEMPLALQAKVLRVVETREVIPIGGTRVRRLDVRFLAATNRNLRDRIRDGQFREDLYFRLSGVTIEVPPLRLRRSEIAPLARLFAAEAAAALGRQAAPELSPEVLRFLEEQRWPGNVRELRNCVERAVLLSSSNALSVDDVDPSCERLVPRGTQKAMRIVETQDSGDRPGAQLDEREQIQDALARCGGNQTRAAAMLGMARRTLVKKLATMGLPRPRR